MLDSAFTSVKLPRRRLLPRRCCDSQSRETIRLHPSPIVLEQHVCKTFGSADVVVWAWGQPREAICDRSVSPWDDAERRPSHADRRKALQRQCLRHEFQQLAEGQALAPESKTSSAA
jgi:hypothetical protein